MWVIYVAMYLAYVLIGAVIVAEIGEQLNIGQPGPIEWPIVVHLWPLVLVCLAIFGREKYEHAMSSDDVSAEDDSGDDSHFAA